jgi:hypothetical protein
MPDWISVVILVAIPLIAAVAGLAWGRVILGLLTVTGLLVVLWMLAVFAIAADWHHAGGFFECGRRCTDVQNTTSYVLLYTPVIVGVLLVTVLVSAFALKSRTE